MVSVWPVRLSWLRLLLKPVDLGAVGVAVVEGEVEEVVAAVLQMMGLVVVVVAVAVVVLVLMLCSRLQVSLQCEARRCPA